MSNIFVLLDGLAVHDVLIWLRDNSDQEVQQDDDDDELVGEPDEPDQKHNRESFVGEWFVSWVINVSDGILPDVEEHADEVSFLETFSSWCDDAALNVEHDEANDPNEQVSRKWNDVNETSWNQIHQKTELIINSEEEIDFHDHLQNDHHFQISLNLWCFLKWARKEDPEASIPKQVHQIPELRKVVESISFDLNNLINKENDWCKKLMKMQIWLSNPLFFAKTVNLKNIGKK